MEQVKTFSFGGGVQSTACLVLAAQGALDYRTFVFVNVGEDSENPHTLAYIEQYSRPFALAHGLEFVELRKHTYGRSETLWHYIERRRRQLVLPAHFGGSGRGNRTCTEKFKIRVIGSFQYRLGARRTNQGCNGLGISTDEVHRCRTHSPVPWQVLHYPLIDLGLDRAACMVIVQEAGLPVPPKSSCWFCPFKRPAEWVRLRAERPDLWQRALWLEAELNRRRAERCQDPVYLHWSRRPLAEAIETDPQASTAADALELCESGHCMT